MNDANLIPFKPGHDPRRNTKGRPKTFKQLRALAVQIAQEQTEDKRGDTVTRIEKMLRDMMRSDNPSDRALILKYAFGNVPDEVEVNGEVKIKVRLVNHDNG